MPFVRVTFSQLQDRLDQRIGGKQTFWTIFEKQMAINEALNVWQLLVGEFTVYGDYYADNFGIGYWGVLVDPSTTTDVNIVNTTDSSVVANYPLSLRRVTYTTTTDTSIAPTAVPQLSVQEWIKDKYLVFDSTTSTPDYWAPWGFNMIFATPVFSGITNPDHFTLEYYRGDKILDVDGDYIQLGEEEINRILDYAVWQLNLKSGMDEAFKNTNGLMELFKSAAELRNAKLRRSQLYKDYMGRDWGEGAPERQAEIQKGGR